MRELIRYCCVGFGAVVIDYLSYIFMMDLFMLNASFSKGVSYILGALFAFTLNKIWTFKTDVPTHKAFGRFSVLYLSTFTANVVINATLLWLGLWVTIAFTAATATSIVLNYVGQKFWVFRGQS